MVRGAIGVIATLVAWLVAGPAAAQDTVFAQRAAVEAAFLRNFARYVVWPGSAFANDRAPWTICVLAAEHFDDTLEKTFVGRSEQGRRFEIVRARALEQLQGCQIVFVGTANATLRRAVLSELRRQPVLTVGEAPEFLEEGGIVRLLAGDRIEMGINLDQARAASLAIPSKMLEVAHEVYENGALRRWK
ncbi:MAG: YfiR family protein [Burkholderiales bacterium]|nr:YfiR family protein [Burkholderiales bacterium]